MSASRMDMQFAKASTIVQHTADYIGAVGEISIDLRTKRLILHDGCTCNGVCYAQLEPTDCAYVPPVEE